MFSRTQDEILEILKKLDKSDYDFSLLFISPAGYTIIKTFFDSKKINIKQAIFSKDTTSFLGKLGFFGDDYCISDLKKGRILPIRTINSQDGVDIDTITDEFVTLLGEFLGSDDYGLISSMQKIIGELLNNISNHSGTCDIFDNTGEVIISANYQSGQFYTKKDFIQIAVIDAGVGILSSVRKKIPGISTAKDAILKALEPRFTGGTTLDPNNKNYSGITNRGIGLTTTLEILKKIEGDLFIGTFDCLYGFNGKTKEVSFKKISSWKGAILVFNIYSDNRTYISPEQIEKDLLGEIPTMSIEIENSIDFG